MNRYPGDPDQTTLALVPDLDDVGLVSEFDDVLANDRVVFGQVDPRELWLAAAANRASIEEQLLATAPPRENGVRVAGHSLQGTWVALDLVGRSTGSLLLAVLDEPLTQEAGQEMTGLLRRRLLSRLDLPQGHAEAPLVDAPVSATVRSRLLVAVASDERREPWDWLAD